MPSPLDDSVNCGFGAYWNYYLRATLWVQGAIASGIVYGAVVILSYFCVLVLWQNNARKHRSFKNRLLLAYVVGMFVLSTLILASNMDNLFNGTKLPFCAHGPAMDGIEMANSLGRLGDVSYVIGNWAADVLLIWRCMVIYRGSRAPQWVVVILPVLLFLSTIATGIVFLGFHQNPSQFNLRGVQSIHSITTFASNVVVTTMIISRLLFYRRRIVGLLGSEYGTPYTGIIAMVVESQVLIVITGLVLVIEIFKEGARPESALLAYQIVSQVQIFTPLLILYRVAKGKAWSSGTFDKVTVANTEERMTNAMSTVRFSTTIDSSRPNATIKDREQSRDDYVGAAV